MLKTSGSVGRGAANSNHLMKLPSLRVLSNSGLALVLIGGTAVWAVPYMLAARRMEHFCSELPLGSTPAQVQALAQPHGYELGTPAGAQAQLVDPLSFGRRQCGLDFGPAGLTAARFSSGS